MENSDFDDNLKSKCLLQSVSASNLVKSLRKSTRILLRNTPHLPYEEEYEPEVGSETRGEPETDCTRVKTWTWYPPASINYASIDDEGFGVERLNPLTRTLQVKLS